MALLLNLNREGTTVHIEYGKTSGEPEKGTLQIIIDGTGESPETVTVQFPLLTKDIDCSAYGVRAMKVILECSSGATDAELFC